MVSAYLEGEDVFKDVCLQYCRHLLPQQNTLALILPLILGHSKTSLKDVNLQGWSRMLSGLLAIVPKETANTLIMELGASLQAQHRLIPAQICAMLCGRELQAFTVNPCFALLGGEVIEEAPSGSIEDQESSLVACIAASEIYEYGLSLTNGMYRSRALGSVKLLHALHCEEKGLLEQARGYVDELNGFVKNYRVNNVNFQNQLEMLQQRLKTEESDEGKSENSSIFGHLLSAVDKGINSIMATVEGDMSPQSLDQSVSPVIQHAGTPLISQSVAPLMPQSATPLALQEPVTPTSQEPVTPLGYQQPTTPLGQQPATPLGYQQPLVTPLGQHPGPSPQVSQRQPELGTSRPVSSQRRSHRSDSHKRPFIPFIPTTPLSETTPESINPTSVPTEKPVSENTVVKEDHTVSSVVNEDHVVPEESPRHVMFAPPPVPMKIEPMETQAPAPVAHSEETPQPQLLPSQPKPTPQPKQTPKSVSTPEETQKKEERSSWSLFGSLFGRSDSGKKVYKVELPKEEVKPYYDEVKKKWIIPGVEEEEEAAPLPPPPPMVSAPVQPADPTEPAEPVNPPANPIKPIEPIHPPVQPIMPVPQAQMEENEQSQHNQVQSDQSPSQPRRQNKRVAKSKPKSRQMPLYTNPFSRFC